MSRAVWPVRVVWWVFVALLSVFWWSPAIVLAVAALAVDRLRFRLAVGLAAALREVGAVNLAKAVYRHELRRARRRKAEVMARRGW